MTKKYTWDKDGKMTSEDSTHEKGKPNEHYCIKGDQIDINTDNIESIFNRINGTNEHPGMFTNIHLINEKLAGIISKQKSIEGWTKAVLSIFVFLVGIGIVMFIKIQQFPSDYVAKANMNQWVDELREQTKLMQKMSLVGADSVVFYKKQLELMQASESLFKMMRTNRGAKSSNLKTKLPGGIDPDKLYNELKKQKEAGTDTGTYHEQVKRIDPNLIK